MSVNCVLVYEFIAVLCVEVNANKCLIFFTFTFFLQVLAYIRTGHRANIFSAKFLPNSGDSHVCVPIFSRSLFSSFNHISCTKYLILMILSIFLYFLTILAITFVQKVFSYLLCKFALKK